MPEIGRKHRLFFGVPVAPDVAARLAGKLPQDLPGKAVPTGKWHFTVRFVGSVDDEERDRLVKAFQLFKASEAFSVTLTGLGAFPNRRRARVLWVGVGDGAGMLAQLARSIENFARSQGLAPEDRPYRPHLTLAHIDPPQSVIHIIEKAKPFRVTMHVDAVILFNSVGGRYEPLVRIEL